MNEPQFDIDHDGKCRYHPEIHLQRKISSGGWKRVLSRCPLCSISALNPRKDASKARTRSTMAALCSSNPLSLKESLPKSGIGTFGLDKDFSNMSMASTDITVSSTSASSTSSTSEEQATVSSAAFPVRSTGPSSAAMSREAIFPTTASSAFQSSLLSTRRRVACGMSYLCPETNCIGSYTGQLHPVKQIPHGIGCLRYNDGTRAGGEWFNGSLLPVAARNSSTTSKGTIKNAGVESRPHFHPLPPIDNGRDFHHVEDDVNSLEDNDDYSIVSKGDVSTYSQETKRAHYSAREVKSKLPPLRSSSSIALSRSYLENSCNVNDSTKGNHEYRHAIVRSYVETKKGRVSDICQEHSRSEN